MWASMRTENRWEPQNEGSLIDTASSLGTLPDAGEKVWGQHKKPRKASFEVQAQERGAAAIPRNAWSPMWILLPLRTKAKTWLGEGIKKTCKAGEETGKCSSTRPSPPLRDLESGTLRGPQLSTCLRLRLNQDNRKHWSPSPQYQVRRHWVINNSRPTAGGKAGMWKKALSEVHIQREAEGGSNFEKKSLVKVNTRWIWNTW